MRSDGNERIERSFEVVIEGVEDEGVTLRTHADDGEWGTGFLKWSSIPRDERQYATLGAVGRVVVKRTAKGGRRTEIKFLRPIPSNKTKAEKRAAFRAFVKRMEGVEEPVGMWAVGEWPNMVRDDSDDDSESDPIIDLENKE